MTILKLALLGTLRIALLGCLKVALFMYAFFLSDTFVSGRVTERNSDGGDTASCGATQSNANPKVG